MFNFDQQVAADRLSLLMLRLIAGKETDMTPTFKERTGKVVFELMNQLIYNKQKNCSWKLNSTISFLNVSIPK